MMAWREVIRFVRQRSRVTGAALQPLMFWLLFGVGLDGSIRNTGAVSEAAEASNASQSFGEYFIPGVMMLIILFTAIFTTISIIEDRKEGFLQAVLVAPAPRWSMVLGKVLGLQLTGGSSTVPDMYDRLRVAGAVARETLISAAAAQSGEPRGDPDRP